MEIEKDAVVIPDRAPVALKRRVDRKVLTSSLRAYLFLVPTFILIIVFSYYPAASALYYSFTSWNGVLVGEWIGLKNFVEMTQDKVLMASLSNMLKVVIWSLAITLTVPLFVAELIDSLRHGRAQYWYRLAFVVPIVVPHVVTLLVWRFIYDPDIGLLTGLLTSLGFEVNTRWLGDPNLALYCLMFIGFPFAAGTNVLIYLAGLQAIDSEIRDSARLDGATGWRRLRHIDLPLLRGQIRLLGILAMIGSIQGFGAQLVLTRGGPGYATMVPGMWMYDQAFSYSRMGYAAAIGTTMFIVILILTFVSMRMMRSTTEYVAR